MDADERDICTYLKSWPKQFIAAREINRRAGGKRRYREEPDWALPALGRLVEKGIVESDATGHYRLRLLSENRKERKWVSPQIKEVLDKSSKDFSEIFEIDEDADSFET